MPRSTWKQVPTLCRRYVAVPVLALAVAGCSFSDSSASISKSVSSPLTSSSASSGSDESYKEDVRDATAAHIAAGGDAAELRVRIGALAEEQGISNWEASESTNRAIGAGLAKAGYRNVEVEAFAAGFTQSDQQRQWIQQGFDDAK